MKNLIILLVLSFYSNLAHGLEAKIALLKGEVIVNGKPAVEGQILQVGDHLIAKGKKSFFKIAYDTGTRYLVRDGELRIEELSEKDSRISLLRGDSFFSVDKQDREHFHIKTRTAAMGVRGTTFMIRETAEEAYLCVCSGIVRISKGDQYLDVFKNQDVHVGADSELSKTKATNAMISFALEEINKL